MKIQNVSVFFILFLFLLLSCSENESKDAYTEPGDISNNIYKIIFFMPGDDFASLQQIDIINKIKLEVTDQGIGEISYTGSGMGNMTIVFKLNKDNALDSVKNIIHEVYPEARYRIEPEISNHLRSDHRGNSR